MNNLDVTKRKAGMDQLSTMTVTALKGVGATLEARLKKLGIESVQDLLFHLPLRYEDRTRLYPLSQVRQGQKVTVEGVIEFVEISTARRRTLICIISEGHRTLECRFFHFSASQKKAMICGKKMRCFGEVRLTRKGLQMIHPEYQIFENENPPLLPDRLTPIYPTTEGMHQKRWQNLMFQALQLLKKYSIEDWLPETLLQQLQFPELEQAMYLLHAPGADISISQFDSGHSPGQLRLAFEELLAHQLSLKNIRKKIQKNKTIQLAPENRLSDQLKKSLPFDLTAAQQRVIKEIATDMNQSKPMLRLVQGDVGSGKTLVAAFAALQVMAEGYQVALMAPTEILSEQHALSFNQWLTPLGIEVAWVSGKLKTKQRNATEKAIANGEALMIVGTHALFQKSVMFEKLGLVIVDEQHRFGVHQRLALREKGGGKNWVPHQLIMTATPIPRTLSMTAYADLDTSVLDELPPGRTPVQTAVVSDTRRDEVIERVKVACDGGRQAYWVCTLIEESEVLQCQAAEVTAEYLQKQLKNVRVGLIHGRLKPEEKDRIMQQFKAAEIDLLVATTVIEVGVDVPNASLMIIENPERLGLSQLHQLRGRVGRGETVSHCVLLYHTPLSKNSKERLSIMRETTDGFKIAEKDLEIRGPGEVLGTKQTGIAEFRIADLLLHQHMIPAVNRWAIKMIKENPKDSRALIKRWSGQSERYADV